MFATPRKASDSRRPQGGGDSDREADPISSGGIGRVDFRRFIRSIDEAVGDGIRWGLVVRI